MELKLLQSDAGSEGFTGFNCTFMELKWGRALRSALPFGALIVPLWN